MGETTLIGLFLFFAAVVGLSDLRDRRIPNWLVIVGLATALLGRGWFGGVGALGSGVLGMLISAAMVLPIYRFRGMAAGDVKAIGAAGAFVGWPFAPLATIFVLVAGGACAVAGLLMSRIRGQAWSEAMKQRMPYGVAIALGLGGFTWWQLQSVPHKGFWVFAV